MCGICIDALLHVLQLHSLFILLWYSYVLCIALECGRISKPKNTHCSADGERGAPAVVAGHTFMGSAFHFGVCASQLSG